jgi:hypothetical protein
MLNLSVPEETYFQVDCFRSDNGKEDLVFNLHPRVLSVFAESGEDAATNIVGVSEPRFPGKVGGNVPC